MTPRARSGRPLEDITVERVLGGELADEDLRVHPDTLRAQADVAAAHGNPQLAANLRRAARMTSRMVREAIEGGTERGLLTDR